MDCLTFLSKVLEASAWPIAAVLIALFLRKELQALLPLIKKLKAGPVELELEHLKKEIDSTKHIAQAADVKAKIFATKLDESETPHEVKQNAQRERELSSGGRSCGGRTQGAKGDD